MNAMAKALVLLVLLAHVMVLNCQEEHIVEDEFEQLSYKNGNPSYSFGYGVSDARTGDVKSVWEEKEGDTVKGHYSVLEPDGSMRSVEYSAGPNTGFTAVVNNNGVQTQPEERHIMEEKALRDQERFYDFSEDADIEPVEYSPNERKRKKHPFDSLFKDYSVKKRPKYPMDLEPSEYTHSISIKHPRDEYDPIGEAHSHIGFNSDPDCKTKHKKESQNLYTSISEFRKHPPYESDSYRDTFEKYIDPANIDIEKLIQLYKYNEQYRPTKHDELTALPTSVKYSYPVPPDAPPDSIYPEDLPPRPKKKPRPHNKPEKYPVEDLDDYILVPKKKYKKPPRVVDPIDYHQDMDEEYDHPSGYDDGFDDDRNHKPPRGTGPKEVVRKIVKKRKPTVNLLDIFDI
ncbi:uncharacterized protein [Epargyreus clarus]|uniref:uncharacterized protein n=1 Tax=Epargyreus clarus TaxID=520877 RepID=UPI003C2FF25F